MATPNFNLQAFTQRDAPPISDEARPDTPPVAPEVESPQPPPQPKRGLGAFLISIPVKLWRLRGLIGGLAAIGIAWLGQDALTTQNDYATSTRNYAIAIAILILSLLNPTMPKWFRRTTTDGGRQPALSAAEGTDDGNDELRITNYENSEIQNPKSKIQNQDNPQSQIPNPQLPTPDGNTLTDAPTPVLPTRPSRTRAIADGNGVATYDGLTAPLIVTTNGKANESIPAVVGRQLSVVGRYAALRARLGWRVTAPGLIVALALAAASYLVLQNDIADPLGGWLWAASMAVLLLTFLGAPGWPRGEGLITTPEGDFFGRGVPRIPVRIEVVLVILMMGVAVFMRLWNLEYHPGIFGDEGEQGMDVRAIIEGRPAPIFGVGWWYVPNLAFYMWQFTLKLFGDSTMFGLRMFSGISGIVAVWFVYRTARLFWGTRAGLIAGFMMAVSPVAIQFSRFANVSSETLALWAVGFYFLCMALRYRRWSDWVLAGFFWSLNLYFYPSGKLIVALIGVIGFYSLVRWRLDFVKKYLLGFVLLGLAFGITFMPQAVFSAKDNWQTFLGRANETSIFSAYNQGPTFMRYGLQYDPTWANQTLIQNVTTNPAAWGSLLYQQMRETFDGVYRRGDQVPFYQIGGIHNGTALSPFWAVLALLGLAYALWKFWDARYALPLLWFVAGMSASFLTIDTPNFQRYCGAWPAIMLFPAALLDRVFASSWPAFSGFARKWSAIPVAAVLVFLGVESYNEYFVYYPSTCPYCRDTVQARYVQALGQDYKGYEMGVGGWDVYFNYGSTRFVAKGVEGTDMLSAADALPIMDNNGKGAAFIIYPGNNEYLPILHTFYPMGTEEPVSSDTGQFIFTSYEITKEQLEATRTLRATYRPPTGNSIARDEPNLGAPGPGSHFWTPPDDLAYPASAEWQGGLVAPSYGVYTFALEATSGDARLELDGEVIIEKAQSEVLMVLAKGLHEVRLTGTLPSADAKLWVTWTSGDSLHRIDPFYLFNGPTGGLSAEVGMGLTPDSITQQNPFAGQPPLQRRSDPFIGYRVGSMAFGNGSFVIRWQGKLNLPTEGDYGFSLNQTGAGAVIIDGHTVFGTGPDGAGSGIAHLTAGQHDMDVRFAALGPPARVELYWTPPGAGQPELVPPTVLTPLARSWPYDQAPDAPPANLPPPVEIVPQGAVQPDAWFGKDDLKNPRGVAVDSDGNIYVADRGNYRVVVYSSEGRMLRSWGKQAPGGKEGETAPPAQPGEFGEMLDVAVGEDGTVYVFDATPRLQAFTPTGDFVGSYEPDQLGLRAPNGLSVGVESEAGVGVSPYIAVTGESRILRLPSIQAIEAGQATIQADSESIANSGDDTLEQPVDVVVDPTGNGLVYTIDLKDRIIQLESVAGRWIMSRQWAVPVGREDGGSRLAISSDGKTVYMTDPERKRLAVLSVEQGTIRYFGAEGQGAGQFVGPRGVAVGPDGRVYVLDLNNGVQVFSLAE